MKCNLMSEGQVDAFIQALDDTAPVKGTTKDKHFIDNVKNLPEFMALGNRPRQQVLEKLKGIPEIITNGHIVLTKGQLNDLLKGKIDTFDIVKKSEEFLSLSPNYKNAVRRALTQGKIVKESTTHIPQIDINLDRYAKVNTKFNEGLGDSLDKEIASLKYRYNNSDKHKKSRLYLRVKATNLFKKLGITDQHAKKLGQEYYRKVGEHGLSNDLLARKPRIFPLSSKRYEEVSKTYTKRENYEEHLFSLDENIQGGHFGQRAYGWTRTHIDEVDGNKILVINEIQTDMRGKEGLIPRSKFIKSMVATGVNKAIANGITEIRIPVYRGELSSMHGDGNVARVYSEDIADVIESFAEDTSKYGLNMELKKNPLVHTDYVGTAKQDGVVKSNEEVYEKIGEENPGLRLAYNTVLEKVNRQPDLSRLWPMLKYEISRGDLHITQANAALEMRTWQLGYTDYKLAAKELKSGRHLETKNSRANKTYELKKRLLALSESRIHNNSLFTDKISKNMDKFLSDKMMSVDEVYKAIGLDKSKLGPKEELNLISAYLVPRANKIIPTEVAEQYINNSKKFAEGKLRESDFIGFKEHLARERHEGTEWSDEMLDSFQKDREKLFKSYKELLSFKFESSPRMSDATEFEDMTLTLSRNDDALEGKDEYGQVPYFMGLVFTAMGLDSLSTKSLEN